MFPKNQKVFHETAWMVKRAGQGQEQAIYQILEFLVNQKKK